MKDFANIDFTTGAFPTVTADQSSGPTVRDGAPLDADWLNDLWGSFQALLSKAGITPSGSNESTTASDILDAIRKISGAPGEITLWGGRSEDPIVHKNRLMVLGGQVIAIASYPDLVAAVYCGDANNPTASSFYLTSDAGGTVRSVLGTYLVLPNSAGKFVRALDGAYATKDTDRIAAGTEDEPGSSQAYQSGTHEHVVGWQSGLTKKKLVATELYTATAGTLISYLALDSEIIDPATSSTHGDGTTLAGGYDITTADDETRPMNTAFYLMIRY